MILACEASYLFVYFCGGHCLFKVFIGITIESDQKVVLHVLGKTVSVPCT